MKSDAATLNSRFSKKIGNWKWLFKWIAAAQACNKSCLWNLIGRTWSSTFSTRKKMPEPKKLKIETHFLVSRNRHKRKEKIANYFTESCADGCKNSFVHFAPQHMHQLESLATRSFNANCLTLIDKYFENIFRKYLAEWKIFCKFLGILPRCHQKFH